MIRNYIDNSVMMIGRQTSYEIPKTIRKDYRCTFFTSEEIPCYSLPSSVLHAIAIASTYAIEKLIWIAMREMTNYDMISYLLSGER